MKGGFNLLAFSSLAKSGPFPTNQLLTKSIHDVVSEKIRRVHAQRKPKIGRGKLPHIASQNSRDFLLSILWGVDKENRALILVDELPRPSGVDI